MNGNLTTVRQDIRRTRRELWVVNIRQAARRVIDVLHFGTSSSERIAAALVMNSVFFFLSLALTKLAGVGMKEGLLLGLASLVLVFAASAVLILWGSDDQLAAEKKRAAVALETLREEAAELQAKEDERQEEEEDAPVVYRPREQSRRVEPRNQRCPYCREVIRANAGKCKHCGEYLDDDLRQPDWNPGIAAVLSFLIPGVGQIYKRQIVKGLLFLFFIQTGYVLAIASFACLVGFVALPCVMLLHLICVFDAAAG